MGYSEIKTQGEFRNVRQLIVLTLSGSLVKLIDRPVDWMFDFHAPDTKLLKLTILTYNYFKCDYFKHRIPAYFLIYADSLEQLNLKSSN